MTPETSVHQRRLLGGAKEDGLLVIVVPFQSLKLACPPFLLYFHLPLYYLNKA
jgi:hypothetical protein